MHAYRFGMNFEETIVGKLTEVYQTVHLKELTDFPKKDEKDLLLVNGAGLVSQAAGHNLSL